MWIDIGYERPPVLGRVVYLLTERDRFGDLREKYRVQLATKAGRWSKSWIYTYPGPIQRGYKLAGLAPDMPDDKVKCEICGSSDHRAFFHRNDTGP